MDEFRYLSAARITSESARIEENIIPKILQIFADNELSYREAQWISEILVQEVESECNGVLCRAKFGENEGADAHGRELL